MKIGIMGANGFVGRSLCLKYLNENNIVFAFYHKNSSSIPKGCLVIPINEAHQHQLDCLVISIGGHNSTYAEFLDHYLVLDFAIKNFKYNKIIFISSVEVYGKNEDVISVESSFNNPSIYGLAKIGQEFLIRSTTNFTIIRPTYLFGTGMNENSLLPMWINKAKNEKEIVVYGTGKREQDYLHIDDFAQLCWLATLNTISNNTVIAASGESITNATLAKDISHNVSGCVVNYIGQDNASSYLFDVSNTKKVYDWSSKITIKDWLKEVFDK